MIIESTRERRQNQLLSLRILCWVSAGPYGLSYSTASASDGGAGFDRRVSLDGEVSVDSDRHFKVLSSS